MPASTSNALNLQAFFTSSSPSVGRVKKTLIVHFFLDISQFIKIVHFKHERRFLFLNDGCGYFAHFGAQYAYAVALLP